jgi:hypothetical protein
MKRKQDIERKNYHPKERTYNNSEVFYACDVQNWIYAG